MARLAREIEKKLAFFDKRRHCSGITNIGKIDSHAIPDVVNVKKVPAIFRDQTVHQGNLCAELDQTPGQSGADETEPTELRELLYYLVDTVLDRQTPAEPTPVPLLQLTPVSQ